MVHDVIAQVDTGYLVVTLDPQMIANMALALGTDREFPGLTLFVPIPNENAPSITNGINVLGPAGIGVIMPLGGDDVHEVCDDFNGFRAEFCAARKACPPRQEIDPVETEDKPDSQTGQPDSEPDSPISEADPLAALMLMTT